MAKKKNQNALPAEHNDLSHIVPDLRHLALNIDLLKDDPENANIHPPDNISVIEQSMREFGQDQPVVVQLPEYIVRKGNGRLVAARNLGWRYIAAVKVTE